MREDVIHIAVGFDNNYHAYCGVLMLSICINTPGPICFHALIAENVTEKTKNQITDMVKAYSNDIQWYTVNESLLSSLNVPISSHFSSSSFNRLFLPRLLPTDVNKIIYLDSDMITLGSLRPVWDIELNEDEPAAMTVDFACNSILVHNSIGLPPSRKYYNSGMMLMNIPCWKKEDICQKCMKLLSDRILPFVDQDAINITIGDRIRELHLRYNMQIFFKTTPENMWQLDLDKYSAQAHEALSSPVVIHYVGAEKPWQEGYRFSDEWMRYKEISPWKDYPLQRFTTKNNYHLDMPLSGKVDVRAMDSIIPAFVNISCHLFNKHHKLFVFVRKAAWTISRLIEK